MNTTILRLQQLREVIEDDIEDFMSGECIPFAVALVKVFPQYDIAVFGEIIDTLDDDGNEYSMFGFVHAFCYDPKNDRIIVDARGVRNISKLYDEFYDVEEPDMDWDILSPQYLIDTYAGKDFGAFETYEYDFSEYDRALKFIYDHKDKYRLETHEQHNS